MLGSCFFWRPARVNHSCRKSRRRSQLGEFLLRWWPHVAHEVTGQLNSSLVADRFRWLRIQLTRINGPSNWFISFHFISLRSLIGCCSLRAKQTINPNGIESIKSNKFLNKWIMENKSESIKQGREGWAEPKGGGGGGGGGGVTRLLQSVLITNQHKTHLYFIPSSWT